MLFDWLKTYWRVNWPSILGVILIWGALVTVLILMTRIK